MYDGEVPWLRSLGKVYVGISILGGKLIDDDDSDAEGVKEVLKFDEDSDDDDDDDSDEEMSQMIKIQMNRLKRQGKGLELESEGEEEEEEEDEKKKPKDDKAGTWGGTKRFELVRKAQKELSILALPLSPYPHPTILSLRKCLFLLPNNE